MKYEDAKTTFVDGTIVNKTREELETIIVVLTRKRMAHNDKDKECERMASCARALLDVRCSQEINHRTVGISTRGYH